MKNYKRLLIPPFLDPLLDRIAICIERKKRRAQNDKESKAESLDEQREGLDS